MTNGKGTFHALKRELAFAHRVGSIRSIGEVMTLRALLVEEIEAIQNDAVDWRLSRSAIEGALRASGIEEDSRIEHHRAMGSSLLRSAVDRLSLVYHRDIDLIDTFLKERGIAAK